MNRNVWLLSVFLVSWMVLSTFWYTCRIKDSCLRIKSNTNQQLNYHAEAVNTVEEKNRATSPTIKNDLDSINTALSPDSVEKVATIEIPNPNAEKKPSLPKLPCPNVDLNGAIPQITDVLFRHASNTVECTYILKKFAGVAKVYLSENGGSIEVIGHSDNSPKSMNSFTLGLKRALAIKLLLMKEGIPSDRIITNSKAETEPVADNSDEKGRQLNRRVSIKIK